MAKAKYFAGETVNKCANYAMRILGAYGYSTDYPVARTSRSGEGQDLGSHQAKQLKIYEIVDMKGAYRGQYGIF